MLLDDSQIPCSEGTWEVLLHNPFQRWRIVALQKVFYVVGFKFYILLYDSPIAVMLSIRWKNRFIYLNVFCSIDFYLGFLAVFMPFFGFFFWRFSLVFRIV